MSGCAPLRRERFDIISDCDRNGKPYYVYELIDPRDETVFYVGKGQGQRAWQHEKRVRAGHVVQNSRKSQRIYDIIGSGHRVGIAIIERFDRDRDALEFEASLIRALPALTNGPNTSLTEFERKLAEKRRKAVEEQIKREFLDRRIRGFSGGHPLPAQVKEFVTALPKTWRRTPEGVSRHLLPRWAKNARHVEIIGGQFSGQVGTIIRTLDRERMVVQLADGARTECELSALKRLR